MLNLLNFDLLTQYIYAFRMIPTSNADYWGQRRGENSIPRRLSVLESNDAILVVLSVELLHITLFETWKFTYYGLWPLSKVSNEEKLISAYFYARLQTYD